MRLNENGVELAVGTDGSCYKNGERNAQAGAGLYINDTDERNAAVRVPARFKQSNQTAEIAAIILAAQSVDERTRLVIESDSKTTLDALTKQAEVNEDTGYIAVQNGDLLRMAVGNLRARKAHVVFKWVKGHNGHPRNEGADRLAAQGAEKEQPTAQWKMEPPEQLRLSGAKIMSMSQSLAYKEIRQRKGKAVAQRRNTKANIERIVEDVQRVCNYAPSDEAIWRALEGKHVTQECKQFLWKVTHQAFRIGDYWLRDGMPDELKTRAKCRICDKIEDMDHILLECESEERTLAWKLTRNLWTSTGERWIEPNWGVVVGSPCVTFRNQQGQRMSLVEARWTILMTETAYFIWKMRCERVIKLEGARFAEQEVKRRWRSTINGRLRMDRWVTSRKQTKRSLSPSELEGVWKPLLASADELPMDWTRNVGVLVGMRHDA
ncbi:ribonuclease H-like protein [Trametes coccinea BRFM310]|uniref:ribonuclease H n=1 Tax=Trametes coccinea (strain BRFM310) TaxID=1353009 RepID=A0A1Y2INR6_TRAC3|nr:ribonuclease H-like protein [Trametes coccinea BRFM310]